MEKKTRVEHDSMGEVIIDESARFGPQTQRALNNFTISDERMPADFIHALLLIKRAAAEANRELGILSQTRAEAILTAVYNIDKLDSGDLMEHFPVPVLQTGSGTSTNMNVNEVIAHLAGAEGVEISAERVPVIRTRG